MTEIIAVPIDPDDDGVHCRGCHLCDTTLECNVDGNALRYERCLAARVRESAPNDRERLGQVVREAWVEWAREQATPKPSWLVPWDELSETDREADRRIGERVAQVVLAQRDTDPAPTVRRVALPIATEVRDTAPSARESAALARVAELESFISGEPVRATEHGSDGEKP